MILFNVWHTLISYRIEDYIYEVEIKHKMITLRNEYKIEFLDNIEENSWMCIENCK